MSVQLSFDNDAQQNSEFPTAEVDRRLQVELENIAKDASLLRPAWEPLLDSRRVVGVVLALEGLFPGCKIPPDKAVRKGGYQSIQECKQDVLPRIREIVSPQLIVRG